MKLGGGGVGVISVSGVVDWLGVGLQVRRVVNFVKYIYNILKMKCSLNPGLNTLCDICLLRRV